MLEATATAIASSVLGDRDRTRQPGTSISLVAQFRKIYGLVGWIFVLFCIGPTIPTPQEVSLYPLCRIFLLRKCFTPCLFLPFIFTTKVQITKLVNYI